MPRPKLIKAHRVPVKISLDPLVLEMARFDIDNLSAFTEVCLKKHILSLMKNNPDFKKKLTEKYGDDIVFIMRSSRRSSPPTLSMSEEEFDNLLAEVSV